MTRVFNRAEMKSRRQQLRRNMPEEERILWSQIKRCNIKGYRFRRQFGVGPFVLDFYCPELKLAIEIDGEMHARTEAKQYDMNREQTIRSLGIHVLRFKNKDIRENLSDVLKILSHTVDSLRLQMDQPLAAEHAEPAFSQQVPHTMTR